MYWFDEKDPDFISFCENTNYAPAVELFTLVSVNIVHLLFLDFMTMLDLGSAYIMFWWCVCFNAAAIMGLVLIVCLPVVCKHELFFFFISFSFLFLFFFFSFLFLFFFFSFSFSFFPLFIQAFFVLPLAVFHQLQSEFNDCWGVLSALDAGASPDWDGPGNSHAPRNDPAAWSSRSGQQLGGPRDQLCAECGPHFVFDD